MDDVLPDDPSLAPPTPLGDVAFEQFLLEEGLGLLATFRTIRNVAVRGEFLTMVKAIAAATP